MPTEEREWLDSGFISQEQFAAIEDIREGRVFSISSELQGLLYLGVLLLATGTGIIIYNHIGSVGHLIAIGLIAILCAGSYWYIFSRSVDYSPSKTDDPNPYYGYLTLLAALLSASLLTYLQLQFEAFGDQWSWLTLVTAALFAYIAYRFDHIGVLGLAITSLASFLGLRIEPDLFNPSITLDGLYYYNTGIVLAIALAVIGLWLKSKEIKDHFTPVYMQFAALLGLLSAMSATFDLGLVSWYSVAAIVLSACSVYYALRVKSTWYMLYGVSVAYIIVSAWVIHFCWEVLDGDNIILLFIYFTASPIVPLLLILKSRRRFK